MCNYQGHEFGAHYVDSVCIDGYLWDADSCDAEGNLYGDGDLPCPACNLSSWREYHGECLSEDAWVACCEGRWPFSRSKGGALWGNWREIIGIAEFAWNTMHGRTRNIPLPISNFEETRPCRSQKCRSVP